MTSGTISTEHAPQPVGAYSQGKRIGNLIQVAGQLAIDPATGIMISGDIVEQTQLSLANVSAILDAAGATWADVLTVRAYLSSDRDFDAFDRTYATIVSQPFPARVVTGAELAPGALVEIDVLAVAAEPPATQPPTH